MATLQGKSNWCIDEKPFFKYFNSLSSKPDTTFRVFDHGEFYSIHEKDAFNGANIVFNSQAYIKILNNSNGKNFFFKF